MIKFRSQDNPDPGPGLYEPFDTFWGVGGDVELFGTCLAYPPLPMAKGLRMGPFEVIPALIPAW